MTMPWTAESKERARADGRYLVKVLVQGRHVDGSRIEYAGDVDPDRASELLAWFGRLVAGVPPVRLVDDRDVLHDLLSLVVRPSELPLRAHLAEWTAEQCAEVEAWAAAEHLEASDNDVTRLPMPEVLRQYQCRHNFDIVNGLCSGCASRVDPPPRCTGCGVELAPWAHPDGARCQECSRGR